MLFLGDRVTVGEVGTSDGDDGGDNSMNVTPLNCSPKIVKMVDFTVSALL